MKVIETDLDLSLIEVETNPPPMPPPLDAQIECLLDQMKPCQAVVLPAATAYLVLIKALGMGISLALRTVPESETHIRVYKVPAESHETTFPRAFVR